MGAKVSNKLRPLRIQFNNLGHRRSVLANAKKLHNSWYVCINPDLHWKERQAQKELRSELARRKERGETDIVIHRGHIVKQIKPNNISVSHSQQSSPETMDDQSG